MDPSITIVVPGGLTETRTPGSQFVEVRNKSVNRKYYAIYIYTQASYTQI